MKQRSLRRAAERQAAKLSRQQAIHEQPAIKTGCTGPTTPEGKAISCLNNTKHGLTGIFRVHESESQEQFDELRNALRAEHAPATPTEILLVDRLAEHTWLSQRAQRIGDAALTDHSETWFALMLRYRTTHDRAFHKCLTELRTIRRERDQENKRAEAHRPLDAAPDERGTSRVWPHLASPLCASSLEEFESQNAVALPEVLVKSVPEFESQTPKRYTKAELDRLSSAEISALVQNALKKANLNLDHFEDCEDELRIAKLSEAA